MITTRRARVLLIAAVFLASMNRSSGQSAPVILSTSEPGVAVEGRNSVLIAFPIINRGTGTAYDVEIKSIELQSARRIESTTLPLKLGNITPKVRGVGEATFSMSRLMRDRRYQLQINGTYSLGTTTYNFSTHEYITLPPSAPGSARVRLTEVLPKTVSGAPYPHRDPAFPPEVNAQGPPIPTGPRRGNLMPTSPSTSIEMGRPRVPSPGTGDGLDAAKFLNTRTDFAGVAVKNLLPQRPDLVFVRNTTYGRQGQPNDPSGASGGFTFNGPQTVLASANWHAAYSNDGGSTFTQIDPTTIFPNNADGGFCCDQVVHYVHSINRFIWLMQFVSGANNQNRLRIASASPEQLIATRGTGWTYWDLTSAGFNLGNNSMDYPDLSVGDHFLYVSVDANGGLLVARIPLTELRDSLTIHAGYTNPADSTSAYGRHLVQNPLDEIFWAGQPKNSVLRIFSWKEGTNSYFWRDVNVNSYPVDYTSMSPDGSNWLASLFYTGPGGTRLLNLGGTDQLVFAWSGGRGGGFPQPHIQLVRIRHSNFSVIEQTQIWNSGIGFGFASLTTSANGLLGVSLAFGGGNFFGSPAVGVLGDGVLYAACTSASNSGRYGDYSTVRQAFPNGALFSAEGYCVNAGPRSDSHYIVFGRSLDVNPGPIP